MQERYVKDDIELEWMDNSEKGGGTLYRMLAECWADYVDELNRIDNQVEIGGPLTLPEENLSQRYLMIWKRTGKGLKFAGFIFLSIWPSSFSRHDAYVGELYIKPELRKNKIATKAMEICLESDIGDEKDFTMYILEGNYPARMFWKQFFEKRGYTERLTDGNVTATIKGWNNCRFYYYTKEARSGEF